MTNKNHGFIGQIVNKESRTRFYANMLEALTGTQPEVPHTTQPKPKDEDEHVPINTDVRYQISKKSATRTDLSVAQRKRE